MFFFSLLGFFFLDRDYLISLFCSGLFCSVLFCSVLFWSGLSSGLSSVLFCRERFGKPDVLFLLFWSDLGWFDLI